MLFAREGLPEEDDILICTVKKILHNSVFVSLDEYKNIEGMLHISEIAPGRIRNIRDYVKPNKKIVCKVLRIDPRYKSIDVSLRRVSLMARKKKLEDYKQELRAEKIISDIAKEKKIPQKDVYQKLAKPIIDKFGSLFNGFNDILNNNEKSLEDTEIKKPLIELIVKTVKEKTKAPEVQIEALVKLTNYESDGINKIKEILKKALQAANAKNYKLEFSYISAPNYRLRIKAKNYKDAESMLKETITNITNYSKETKTLLEWQKKS